MAEKVKIFCGMMRPDESILNSNADIICSCGMILRTKAGAYQHWLQGHFDTPVYAEVDPIEVAIAKEKIQQGNEGSKR